MQLKKKTENKTGLNTTFINTATNRTITRNQAIKQIQKNNPNYKNYHISHTSDGTPYVRSNPDSKKNNNIE